MLCRNIAHLLSLSILLWIIFLEHLIGVPLLFVWCILHQNHILPGWIVLSAWCASTVVYDFGVKYTRQKDAEHLLSVLEKEFTAVSTDWEGALYCGITLEWNYEERWLDISIPGYIKKNYKITSMNHPRNHNTHHMSSPQRNMAKMPMTSSP